MTDLEGRLRGTLTDKRRRLDPPHDVSAWVAAGVSHQRRRLAAATAVVTVAVLALGSAVVLPIVLRDDPATYVAGVPEEETGLLPWDPVGSLIEDSAAIESAVRAWSDDAPAGQQPDGDVYVLMAGAEVGGGGGPTFKVARLMATRCSHFSLEAMIPLTGTLSTRRRSAIRPAPSSWLCHRARTSRDRR